ncbi:unnamed protein product, partial [Prorocentrum cordatum]
GGPGGGRRRRGRRRGGRREGRARARAPRLDLPVPRGGRVGGRDAAGGAVLAAAPRAGALAAQGRFLPALRHPGRRGAAAGQGRGGGVRRGLAVLVRRVRGRADRPGEDARLRRAHCAGSHPQARPRAARGRAPADPRPGHAGVPGVRHPQARPGARGVAGDGAVPRGAALLRGGAAPAPRAPAGRGRVHSRALRRPH